MAPRWAACLPPYQGCGHNDVVFASLRSYAKFLGLSRLWLAAAQKNWEVTMAALVIQERLPVLRWENHKKCWMMGLASLQSDPTQQFQGNPMHWSTCKVGKRLHWSLGVLWWEEMHWRIKQLLETMIQIEWVNCLSSPCFAWFFARYPYHYSSLNGCLNYQADICKHI